MPPKRPPRNGRPRVHRDGEKRQFIIIYATPEETDLILQLTTQERKHVLLSAALNRIAKNMEPVPAFLREPATEQ